MWLIGTLTFTNSEEIMSVRCTTFRTDSIENAWLDIRSVFGPIVQVGSATYNKDIDEWTSWAISNSFDPISDVSLFGKWLMWKCNFGTTNYGNLPTKKRDHEGISCIPCPYDSTSYDPIRSALWIGNEPVTTSDHGKHYMRIHNRGSKWGFECTYSGCPFSIEHGYPYFR